MRDEKGTRWGADCVVDQSITVLSMALGRLPAHDGRHGRIDRYHTLLAVQERDGFGNKIEAVRPTVLENFVGTWLREVVLPSTG